MRMKQHLPYLTIIGLWEFQKFKLNYLEDGSIEFREKFTTPVICHYLPLIVLTQFLLPLSTYGGAINFPNFRHYKSIAILMDKFKVHCLRNGSFKF